MVALRDAGFSDSVILNAVQIVGYFNLVNRQTLALGVETTNQTIGQSDSADGLDAASRRGVRANQVVLLFLTSSQAPPDTPIIRWRLKRIILAGTAP